MFRKYLSIFLLINLSSLYAILGGAGVRFAQDSFSVDSDVFEGPGDIATISRTQIDSPIGAGAFVYLTIIPFIDIEAGFDLTGSLYEYSYQDLIGNDTKVELGLLKGTWNLSLQRPIFKFPTIRMYAGGGLNGSTYTKIVTMDLMQDLDETRLDDLDYIKEELGVTTSGSHIEIGARFKPPIIPLSLNANARYNFIKDIIPGEDKFLSISLGLAFAI